MAFIEWTDDLSVGIQVFDNQHKKLIEQVNKMYDAMKAGKGRSVLGEVLDELISYTDSHFKTEEEFFERYGYPDAGLHSGQHKQLMEKVYELQDKYAGGNTLISVELLEFLRNWVENHIQSTDKQYTEFFHEKGVS
ncbi:MAG: bacteriohemerythrin [Spirochaetia bacterium]